MAFLHCHFLSVGLTPAIIPEVEYSCSFAVDVSIHGHADLKDDVAILATVRTKKQQSGPEVIRVEYGL